MSSVVIFGLFVLEVAFVGVLEDTDEVTKEGEVVVVVWLEDGLGGLELLEDGSCSIV